MKLFLYFSLLLILIYFISCQNKEKAISINAEKNDLSDSIGYLIEFGPTPHVYPKLISKPEIFLPDSIKDIEGKIVITCNLNIYGNPDSCQIQKSTNKKLNDYAIKYVQNMKFEPGTLNNNPTIFKMTIPIIF